MVPEVAAAVSERPTATSKRRVTGSSDALWSDVPMPTQKAANGYKRLVQLGGLYICAPPAIRRLLESQDITLTSKNTSKPSMSIEIKSFVLSTSFVSISARLALE